MPRGVPLDLSGQRFGQWTVERKLKTRDAYGQVRWSCWCDCGNWSAVVTTNLRSGRSTRCRDCAWKALRAENRLSVDTVVSDFESGISMVALAEKYSVDRDTLSRVLKEAGARRRG